MSGWYPCCSCECYCGNLADIDVELDMTGGGCGCSALTGTWTLSYHLCVPYPSDANICYWRYELSPLICTWKYIVVLFQSHLSGSGTSGIYNLYFATEASYPNRQTGGATPESPVAIWNTADKTCPPSNLTLTGTNNLYCSWNSNPILNPP